MMPITLKTLVAGGEDGKVEGIPLALARECPLTFRKLVYRSYLWKYREDIRSYLADPDWGATRKTHLFHRFFDDPFVKKCKICGGWFLHFNMTGATMERCHCPRWWGAVGRNHKQNLEMFFHNMALAMGPKEIPHDDNGGE